MAVEIPVVIDIDKAFEDAASRVGTAMKSLQGAVDQRPLTANITIGNLENSNQQLKEMRKYYKDLEDADWTRIGEQLDLTPYINQSIMRLQSLEAELNDIQELRRLEGGSGDFYFAEEYRKVKTEIDGVIAGISAMQNAQSQLNATLSSGGIQNYLHSLMGSNTELQKMNEYYRELEASSQKMSDSINAIRGRLADLNAEWNNLSKEDRQSTRGAAILNQAREETRLLKEEALTIDQILQKERKKSDLINQGIQKRRYENAILNASVTSMRVLQEQERILSDRLNRTNIQSSKYAELRDQLEQVRAKMQQLQGEASRTSVTLSEQSRVMQNLTSMASTYVSVFGALRFAKQIRDVTGELEYQRVALGHLIQDEEYGAKLFEQIQESAVKSPFRIKDLVTYTKQLAAYRIEQEDLMDTTNRLADISAGLGVDMNRLILAYGQVRAASVLRGQELRQFTEAGIPLVELLAEKMGELNDRSYSTADVFKLISQRAVPFSAIASIFEDLTSKGEMFYKMQEIQAQTLQGRWEKLKDTFDIALQSIGESEGLMSFKTYNDVVLRALELLAKNLRVIPKLIEGVSAAWLVYYVATTRSRKALRDLRIEEYSAAHAQEIRSLATKKGIKNADAYTAAMVRQRVATTALTRGFYALKAAIIANPWGAAIAGVSAIITIFTSFRKKTDEAQKSLSDFSDAIEAAGQSEKKYANASSLIDRYEKLASSTERTGTENERLNKIMSRLREMFPDMAAAIDGENESLEENVRLLRGKNEEEHKRSIEKAKEDLDVAQGNVKVLEEQRKARQAAYDEAYAEYSMQQKVNEFYKDSESLQKSSSKAMQKALEKVNETSAALDETDKELNNLYRDIARLEKIVNPTETQASGWQEQLKKMLIYKTSLGDAQIFTPADVDNLESVYDLFKQLKKIWQEAKTDAEGLEAAYRSATDPIVRGTLFTEWQDALAKFNKSDEIRQFYGFNFKSGGSSRGSSTDPFITLMQNRIKFMQDFKKGYEDLNKYMSSSEAQMEEANIMLGRGQSLGLGPDEQLRAVNDLSKWYEDMINQVQDRLRAKGIKGATPTDFLSIDTAKKSKAIQDLQKLLQQLWDAKTDYDTSQKKKDIEDALKRLSEEIKQTETARNFYQDILDLTGDEQLAATLGVSIYGNIGQDFKDRLQQQLNEAMKTLDASAMTMEMREAFDNQDFGTILENLDKFPEEWRSRLKEMAADSQKFEADRAKDLLKALERAKTYSEQQVQLAKQTAQRTAQIQAMNVKDDVKNQLLKQNAKKEAEESAKIAYEAFKDTPMYIELFSDLDAASLRMLTNMRENLAKMKDNWKDLHPRELKELQSRLNELDEQIAQRNPFKALRNSIKEYRDMQKERSRADVEEAAVAANERLQNEEAILQKYKQEYLETASIEGISKVLVDLMRERMENQAEVVDQAKEEADEAQNAANKYKDVAKHIRDAAEKMQEWAGYVTDSLGGIQQIVGTFASDDTAETFDIIAEGLGKTVSGAAELGQGIAKLVTGDLSGIVDTIKGLGDVVAGTFGTKNQLNIKHLNKKIDEQQTLLDGLTYSYDRLEKAMAKAFGSDYIYNYNEQLKNLQAQQAAYEEQLRLEQNKGKKKDKDKIKDYQDSIQEVEDQIIDMSGGLSEFFTGSDVKSAAEEFANSWIEAYQSFSSTTGAMQEKFQDMIGNMITQSLAGQMMQRLLQPIFDEIDRLSEDGELTAAEIGSISEMATAAIPQIDAAMTGLVNNLAGAGINLRQQAGQFTGISRDIAGASEESILGLAAAVNTANFYISHVPTISENVAAIREVLTGEAVPGRRNTAATRGDVEGPTYEDQMLAYAASIPLMRDDTATIRALLERVIKPVGTTATHYVSIR